MKKHISLMTLLRNMMIGRSLRLCSAKSRCYLYAKFSTYKAFYSKGQFRNFGRLCHSRVNFDKLLVGIDKDEILKTLMKDEGSGVIRVSHEMVDRLLSKYKDDWKLALVVFRWAESCPSFEHSMEGCDLMVDILGKGRQFDQMEELVGEMCERKMVRLNTVSKMMRRFSGARRWRDAVRVFDELGNYGLEKNTESMNLLLDTLCKENRVEMARGVYSELKKHIPPSLHTFNIFVKGWCKINRVEEAHWTLQEMKGHGFSPCVISYSIIIHSYCQLSDWDKVNELLEEMEAQGSPPSVVTYTTVMSSLAKAGELEEALKIPDRVKSAGCKPDTLFYNALIHTLGKAQRVREAYNVFQVDMPKSGVAPNTSTYNTLISMFCYHGQENMAFTVLEDMEKTSSCKPDLQTFCPLLKSCFKSELIDGRLNELLNLMASKHHLSLDDSTYTLLIHGYCRVDMFELALQLFDEMIGKGLIPRYHTCRLLLDGCKQRSMHDDFERVELYFEQLKACHQRSSYVEPAE